MSNRRVPKNGKHDSAIPEPTGEAAQGASQGQEQATPDTEALQQALAEAQAKAEEYLAGWKRERAEFVNYRQRVERQAAQTRDRVRSEVLKGLVDILDDLDLALQNRPTEGEAAAWADGIALIAQKIRTFLRQQGLEPIEPQVGDPFDPYQHEGVDTVASDEVESGHIVEVVRKGYRVGERVLRPAKVRVAA